HPNGKGVYLGFDERHGRGHMFRALIEGLIIQLKAGSDNICKALGTEIGELYVGGGGSKSRLTAQIISDVYGVPVNRVGESENCSLGAAMCGAVGVGVYSNMGEAVKNMVGNFDVFRPNETNHELYKNLSGNVIEKLYPALADVFRELAGLSAGKL
ncbi:MAG: FGGY-family carbohydrate kinase, partial [Treponema sp.]|nr:FGGY-family carbohydrate kinase [Treponema sp.]